MVELPTVLEMGAERRADAGIDELGPVTEATRLPSFEMPSAERCRIGPRRRQETTDLARGKFDIRLKPDALAATRRGDQKGLGEGAEGQQQVAPGGIAGRQVTVRVEQQHNGVAIMAQAPRLRVVRRRRTVGDRLDFAEFAPLHHWATVFSKNATSCNTRPPMRRN